MSRLFAILRLPRFIFVLLALLAAGLPARAVSSSFEADHVRVELMVPGSQLYGVDELNDVGLYFKLEPGWHVYWMNPGDAGEPPHIQWKLPTGITAGPMQFPAPKRLPLGPLMDYGYEDEVLFPLKLHVAETVKGGSVTLHAKVDWLVCRASCIPGKAELEVQKNVYVGPLYTMGSYADPPHSLNALLTNSQGAARRRQSRLPTHANRLPPCCRNGSAGDAGRVFS